MLLTSDFQASNTVDIEILVDDTAQVTRFHRASTELNAKSEQHITTQSLTDRMPCGPD